MNKNTIMKNYLQPNITIDESIEIIKEKIRTKTPFSFTRFGDGEIYVLNRNGFKHTDWERDQLCKTWGYNFPDEIQRGYDELGLIIKKALINTDMIGIMNEYHEIFENPGMKFIADYWSLSEDYVTSLGINIKNLTISESLLPRNKRLGNIHEFSKIIGNNDIHIVSSKTNELKSKNIDKLLGVNVTYTHHPHEVNAYNREHIFDSFKNISSPIVILGCGFLKDYGPILAKEYGKISLDFGATLDAWAGIYSRPWFRNGGLQEHLIVK